MACAALAACGGGGEDKADLSVTVTPSRLDVVKMLDAPWEDRTAINVSIRNGTGTYYIVAAIDQEGVFSSSLELTSATAGAIWLTPVAQAPATQAGEIRIALCADAACNGVVFQKTIPYDVRTFAVVDARPLAFTSPEGAVSAPQQLTVEPPDVDGWLEVTGHLPGGAYVGIRHAEFITGTPASPSTFDVTTSAVGLGAGTYSAQACVGRGIRADTRVCVPVTFTVTSVAAASER